MVTRNPWLHPVTWAHVGHFWRHSFYGLYGPITYSAYALFALMSQALHPGRGDVFSPSIYHAANLLFHIGATWSLFFLLRRLNFADYAAFPAALFFAVHPLMVDAVAWIGGMDTVLSTLFAFLALIAYTSYAGLSIEPNRSRRRWLFFGIASLFYLLAVLTKPPAMCLPVIAGLLDLFCFRRRFRDVALPLLAWVAIAPKWILLMQGTQYVTPSAVVSYWQRPFVAADAIAFYLVKLVLPFRLALDYGRSSTLVSHEAWGYLTWLLPAALALISWRLRGRFGWLGIGFAVMAAGLLPMLGLVPFGYQMYSTVADRYVYLGMLGPAIALAGLAALVSRPMWAGLLGILLLLGVQSAVQAGAWRNAETLFAHSLSISPNCANIQMLLGGVYAGRGDATDALAHYQAAARIAPDNADACANAGASMEILGEREQAIPYLEQAVRDDPTIAKAHFGLGLAYAETGRVGDAVKEWQQAVSLAPQRADYRYNLGVALFRMGRYGEAAGQFRALLAVTPNDAGAKRWLSASLAAGKSAAPDRQNHG